MLIFLHLSTNKIIYHFDQFFNIHWTLFKIYLKIIYKPHKKNLGIMSFS
jgi:hypothetical protein